MILDDIIDVIEEAEYPISFPDDLNVGKSVGGEKGEICLTFFPSDTCSIFSSVENVQDDAIVVVHTHGIEVDIDGKNILIHNSQIIIFDWYHFDDTIEYKRSDSRINRVCLGAVLGGPVIGAAIGLAASLGKGKTHIVSDNLVIAYWNIETRGKEIILLETRKDLSEKKVSKIVDYWHEQENINKNTGRHPSGDFKAGVSSSGCFLILLVFLPCIYGFLYFFKSFVC